MPRFFLHKAFAGINKTDSAYKYLLLANALKDSAFGYDQIKSMQLLNYNERSRIEKEAQQKIDAQQKLTANLKLYILIGVLVFITLIAIFLFRNNKQKQAANKVLKLTLTDLKSTQQQLIQ